MKSTEISGSQTQLRVFVAPGAAELADAGNSLLAEQLPFLPGLARNFEAATGWQISFAETKESHRQRLAARRSLALLGKLQISDLSDAMAFGKSAQPRGVCDRLAGTLDEMIRLIQVDRRSFQNINRRLNAVVELPFEWWGLTGKSGYCDGAISAWSITASQKIRLFAGQIQAATPIDSALSGATTIAAFEATCQAGVELDQIAAVLPQVLRKSNLTAARFDWFGSLELDPITGDFGIDGFNADRGLVWIDIQAGTALPISQIGLSETLYAGQVLGVGVTEQQQFDLNEIMSVCQTSVLEFRRIVTKKFADSAALFLYRN